MDLKVIWTPEAAIEQELRVARKASELEQAAVKAIGRNQERLMLVPRGALPEDEASRTVQADVAALSAIHDPIERLFAAMAMADSVETHPAYGTELRQQSPQAAIEVEAAGAESARRERAKDERKAGMQNEVPPARETEAASAAFVAQQAHDPDPQTALLEVIAAIMRNRGDSVQAIELVSEIAAGRLAARRVKVPTHETGSPCFQCQK